MRLRPDINICDNAGLICDTADIVRRWSISHRLGAMDVQSFRYDNNDRSWAGSSFGKTQFRHPYMTHG